MFEFFVALLVVGCLFVVLMNIALPDERHETDRQRLEILDKAMRTAQEMQHDAWETRQRMSQMADSIDVDDVEGR